MGNEEEESCVTQLIDASGEFNINGLENFIQTVKLSECGLSYAVVAIMGPQSSGKSTLLNHLFHTNFREMDAFRGRSQTTKGIWIAKCVGIQPCTIAMDLEGTDGRERGEDDTTFEKQSALFALAIADIVLINMWCHDIGREHAANKPLLKTVFQVMTRLFSPRKTTLLFVIRDKTKTPLEHLEPVLRDDIQKIWHSVSKPSDHKSTPLSEFFNVEVTALPSYEEKEDQFKEQVAVLRQRFFHSIAPRGLAGDRRGVVPASAFSFSAQQIWKVIKENRDLDLPAHKVMVATVRCEEIANEKFSCLTSDESWLALEASVKTGPVSGFGKKLSTILDIHLSDGSSKLPWYTLDCVLLRNSYMTRRRSTSRRRSKECLKRQQLETKALNYVQPAHQCMLGHLRSRAFENFKKGLEHSFNKGEPFAASVRVCTQFCMSEFDKGAADAAIQQANWDPTRVREKLRRDIEAHAASVRSEKLSELKAKYEKQLSEALIEPVESLLDVSGRDTWASIRRLLRHETESALSKFSTSLSGFELDQATYNEMVLDLRQFARSIVEKKAKEEAGKVLTRMKDRFSAVFSRDNDSMPRVWTGKEDIRKITKDARAASLKILSVMAALRLDEKSDKIENVLFSSLMDGTVSVSGSQQSSVGTSADPLASNTWEEVSPKDVLITPVQCKALWRQFKTETEYTVTQAISSQEAHKRSNNWLPPPWAILAMIVLGFNEFMLLLKNPLYLMVVFVVYLLTKAIWSQLDIPGEFRNGTRLADEGQGHPTTEPPRPPTSLASQSFRNQTQKPTPLTQSIPDSSVSSVASSDSGDECTSPMLTRRPTVKDEERDHT
ncbi:hypothetical protein IFM89_028792 [Coptis chinensis]|uniref:Protein ROOT HAIR DEFECTIVE 3 homolog n=1 Tax=Coptis chinensis TaxID=261450 RepID=A0A835H1H1_9MAGN|nr:hypothetical protein IFM89_028792 [Coptis chinensis]